MITPGHHPSCRGAMLVELALTLPIVLMLLFALFQFGVFMENRIVMSNAAIAGARLLASKRGITCPYNRDYHVTACPTPKTGAYNRIRNLLAGTLVSNANLDTDLTISMEIINPDNTTQVCNSNLTCWTALGTLEEPPPPGTLVHVTLDLDVIPFFHAFGLEKLTHIRVETSEPVQ